MKNNRKNLNEFFSTLISAALGSSLGTYLANLFDLHWLALGAVVAIIFLISNYLIIKILKKD